MGKVVLKPYKRKMSTWNYDEDKSRVEEDSNRYILSVQIGEKLTIDEETNEKVETEQLAEEIYLDTLQGIFLNQQGYEVTVTLGYEPQIVIAYEGRLVMHNDKIPLYEEQVMDKLKKTKISPIVQALINFVSNENYGEKYSDLLRHVQNAINDACKTNYPPEFIAYVIKDYICEVKRELVDEQMEFTCMTYEELLQEAGAILIANIQGNKDEQREKYILEELFYRFIQGNLVTKR